MKKLIKLGLLALLTILGFAKTASAATYPIPELGNCASQQECFYYCEIPANQPACWSYGEFVLHKQVLGDATTSAQREIEIKQKVTFPIAELGNCVNITECKAFCDQATNHTVCQSYAQSHGITKPGPTPVDQQTLLTKAKEILGCNSIDECKTFCSSQENRDKCLNFSKSVGIPQPTPKPVPTDIFDEAQKDLGCDSLTSCKDVCSKEENFQKCEDFAQKHNLQRAPRPSGTPESTTGSSRSGDLRPAQSNSQLRPPQQGNLSPNDAVKLYQKLYNTSGCSSTQDCYKYCVEHPGVCPGFPNQYYNAPTPQNPSALNPTSVSGGGNPTPTTCPLRPNYPGCTWIMGSNCQDAKLVCVSPTSSINSGQNSGSESTSGSSSPSTSNTTGF